MNALIEFTILSGISFFIFMYLGFKDATRTKAASGILASLFNNLSFWKAEDEDGIRGYLYKQGIIFKLVVAFVGAVVIRSVYAYFFDFFGTSTGPLSVFTGYTGFVLHMLVILAAIYLSYQWPKVKNKMIAIKEEALKDENEKALEKKSKSGEVKVKEVIKEKVAEKPQEKIKEEPKVEAKPDAKKDDPNDIINDYLK